MDDDNDPFLQRDAPNLLGGVCMEMVPKASRFAIDFAKGHQSNIGGSIVLVKGFVTRCHTCVTRCHTDVTLLSHFCHDWSRLCRISLRTVTLCHAMVTLCHGFWA